MKRITLKKDQHRNQTVLKLEFPYDQELIKICRSIGATWSQSKRCWYMPYSEDAVEKIDSGFKGVARIDQQKLSNEAPENNSWKSPLKGPVDSQITEEVNRFIDWMRNIRYSESTVKTYREGLFLFFKFVADKDPAEVSNQDLEQFHKDYIIAKGYSESFQSQVINAVKLFFKNRLDRTLDPDLIERPKKTKKLPNVLSREEVKRILESPPNIKHRTMLSLIYACGLRRSELLNLKVRDVDSKRKLLVINQAKGGKDRLVPLSEKIIGMLREYYKAYRPQHYLFEGAQKGTPYTGSSLRSVLKQALKRAGIQKPVSLHWLRHSYATHLLENGTDLRYIQEILGHKSSKTTELYTHVSTGNLQQIKNPFDDL